MCVLYRDMNEVSPLHEQLSDAELIAETSRLATSEQQATSRLVSALAEFDARRLYLGQGCSSMFTYCTRVLHLAEHAAYNRIEAARAARRFPSILTLLARADIHLSAVRLLAPHLTEANHRDVLREASHKSKREVEELVARLWPRPDVAPLIRKVPTPHPSGGANSAAIASQFDAEPDCQLVCDQAAAVLDARSHPTPRPKIEPLAPERYKVQFTVSRETYDKLRQAQDLLRHRLPSGDPAAIFDRALTLLLEDLKKQKLAVTERPRAARSTATRSRHVPASVRRTVWARDGGRCRFEGPAGRCGETGRLEFHHVVPYASGGPTSADNMELRCAAHNRYEAEQWFRVLVREERTAYPPLNTT
jgi:5-methylcytosine-specific restriction endonuclease McrA